MMRIRSESAAYVTLLHLELCFFHCRHLSQERWERIDGFIFFQIEIWLDIGMYFYML